MGCDTHGKIKGYIRHEDILNFIQQKWDKNAEDVVQKKIIQPFSECDWNFRINEHNEDPENWYVVCGHIYFKYDDENRSLFYCYSNLGTNDNYYYKIGLPELAESETTFISLGYWGSSVALIKEIVAHFGGGWVDDNDCDTEDYYSVSVDVDENSFQERK